MSISWKIQFYSLHKKITQQYGILYTPHIIFIPINKKIHFKSLSRYLTISFVVRTKSSRGCPVNVIVDSIRMNGPGRYTTGPWRCILEASISMPKMIPWFDVSKRSNEILKAFLDVSAFHRWSYQDDRECNSYSVSTIVGDIPMEWYVKNLTTVDWSVHGHSCRDPLAPECTTTKSRCPILMKGIKTFFRRQLELAKHRFGLDKHPFPLDSSSKSSCGHIKWYKHHKETRMCLELFVDAILFCVRLIQYHADKKWTRKGETSARDFFDRPWQIKNQAYAGGDCESSSSCGFALIFQFQRLWKYMKDDPILQIYGNLIQHYMPLMACGSIDQSTKLIDSMEDVGRIKSETSVIVPEAKVRDAPVYRQTVRYPSGFTCHCFVILMLREKVYQMVENGLKLFKRVKDLSNAEVDKLEFIDYKVPSKVLDNMPSVILECTEWSAGLQDLKSRKLPGLFGISTREEDVVTVARSKTPKMITRSGIGMCTSKTQEYNIYALVDEITSPELLDTYGIGQFVTMNTDTRRRGTRVSHFMGTSLHTMLVPCARPMTPFEICEMNKRIHLMGPFQMPRLPREWDPMTLNTKFGRVYGYMRPMDHSDRNKTSRIRRQMYKDCYVDEYVLL